MKLRYFTVLTPPASTSRSSVGVAFDLEKASKEGKEHKLCIPYPSYELFYFLSLRPGVLLTVTGIARTVVLRRNLSRSDL